MDANSIFLLFTSKQVKAIDFQSKLLDYVFILKHGWFLNEVREL